MFRSLVFVVQCFLLCLTNCTVKSVPINFEPYNSGEAKSEDKRIATNEFVEDIIGAFRQKIGDRLDPLRVPFQRVSFERKLIGIRLHGKSSQPSLKFSMIMFLFSQEKPRLKMEH